MKTRSASALSIVLKSEGFLTHFEMTFFYPLVDFGTFWQRMAEKIWGTFSYPSTCNRETLNPFFNLSVELWILPFSPRPCRYCSIVLTLRKLQKQKRGSPWIGVPLCRRVFTGLGAFQVSAWGRILAHQKLTTSIHWIKVRNEFPCKCTHQSMWFARLTLRLREKVIWRSVKVVLHFLFSKRACTKSVIECF